MSQFIIWPAKSKPGKIVCINVILSIRFPTLLMTKRPNFSQAQTADSPVLPPPFADLDLSGKRDAALAARRCMRRGKTDMFFRSRRKKATRQEQWLFDAGQGGQAKERVEGIKSKHGHGAGVARGSRGKAQRPKPNGSCGLRELQPAAFQLSMPGPRGRVARMAPSQFPCCLKPPGPKGLKPKQTLRA